MRRTLRPPASTAWSARLSKRGKCMRPAARASSPSRRGYALQTATRVTRSASPRPHRRKTWAATSSLWAVPSRQPPTPSPPGTAAKRNLYKLPALGELALKSAKKRIRNRESGKYPLSPFYAGALCVAEAAGATTENAKPE